MTIPNTQPISQRIADLGIAIPTLPEPVAAYIPAIRYGDLIQTAGQIPIKTGVPIRTGTVPDVVSTEQAAEAARQCALNAIAAAAHAAGGIDNLVRPIKVTCFVASPPGYTDHPKVANGASHLLEQIFGDDGTHARAAVGAPSLPLGVPVEVEILFMAKPST